MFGLHTKGAALPDRRDSTRDDVHHRARAVGPDGAPLVLEIVNISASGFMARLEADMSEGDALTVTLPAVGERKAFVRWSLGGRAGCEFVQRIDLAPYLELLGRLMKGTG